MAKKFLVPIDLNKLELQNAALQNLGSAPSSPVKGQVYFNTVNNKAYVYNGSSWVPWEADTNTVTGVKGSAESTYRTGNVNITAANIGLGNVTDGAEVNQNAFSNVKVGSTTIAADSETDTLELVAGSNVTLTPDATNDKVTIAATDTTYSAGTTALITAGTDTANRVWQPKILHDYIASVVGGVDAMRFKGTVNSNSDLPTTGVKVGDTYMVNTAGTYAGQTCEVGDLIIATATTPTWTVAQTNIDGAITNITGTSPVSVTGSGSSRAVSVSYTSVTGKPTADQTPSWGDSFTISQIKQSTTGQITATDRLVYIPSGAVTTTSNGLATPAMLASIQDIPTYTTLTITAGQTSVSTWHTVGSYIAYDASTYEEVVVDLVYGANSRTFSIASAYTNDIKIYVWG